MPTGIDCTRLGREPAVEVDGPTLGCPMRDDRGACKEVRIAARATSDHRATRTAPWDACGVEGVRPASRPRTALSCR